MDDNTHAGQGAVLLDIGGTVGALVVTMPSALVGQEVEIRPIDYVDGGHRHLPHVAVVNRPRDGGKATPVASAVFAELEQGDYELYLRPAGRVELTVTIRGAEVSYATWPTVNRRRASAG